MANRYYPAQHDMQGPDKLERVFRDVYDRLYATREESTKKVNGVQLMIDKVAAANNAAISQLMISGATPAAVPDSVRNRVILFYYGSMYGDELAQTVTIAATNTYVHVPGSLLAGGTVAEAFTFQNAKELKCVYAGIYLVTYSMTINCATNSQDLSGCVMVNTTAQLNTTSHNFNGTGASKNAVVAGTGIVTLAADDLLRLAVADHTAIHDIIVEHVNLTALYMGGV